MRLRVPEYAPTVPDYAPTRSGTEERVYWYQGWRRVRVPAVLCGRLGGAGRGTGKLRYLPTRSVRYVRY
eukprot:2430360-Rhodomonas_salina.1